MQSVVHTMRREATFDTFGRSVTGRTLGGRVRIERDSQTLRNFNRSDYPRALELDKQLGQMV